MNFLAGINRLLRVEHVLSGQDDNITTFADSQHAADISLAQIAIQDEIIELASERLIDYEHTSSTITLLTSTRTYALQTNFVRFFGTPSFYDSNTNTRYYEYTGGEQQLMTDNLQYKTGEGGSKYWYWNSTTTKSVAFYSVPDSSVNGTVLSYEYEKSILVTDTTDIIPFPNNEEAYTFVDLAARRFHFMRTGKERGLLTADPTYNNAKSRLYALMRPTNPPQYYGKSY